MAEQQNPYTDAFYGKQVKVALKSARWMLSPFAAVWTPGSVLDVGCGRGAWLLAWEQLGVSALIGLDGPWVAPADVMSPAIDFRPTDLNQPFGLDEKCDLAMSVEVAEHCRPESSETFVASMCASADAIIFGAAFTGQPGAQHINTRPHSYWCGQFLERGYAVFDYFRPKFWGSRKVAPWYQQNTFVYVRPDHRLFDELLKRGEKPMENPAFVDAIHPWLYDRARETAEEARADRRLSGRRRR
jgi:hypothetical protein